MSERHSEDAARARVKEALRRSCLVLPCSEKRAQSKETTRRKIAAVGPRTNGLSFDGCDPETDCLTGSQRTHAVPLSNGKVKGGARKQWAGLAPWGRGLPFSQSWLVGEPKTPAYDSVVLLKSTPGPSRAVSTL